MYVCTVCTTVHIYAENTKVQALVPIISIAHYATRNFLHNASPVVTLPQCDLFAIN